MVCRIGLKYDADFIDNIEHLVNADPPYIPWIDGSVDIYNQTFSININNARLKGFDYFVATSPKYTLYSKKEDGSIFMEAPSVLEPDISERFSASADANIVSAAMMLRSYNLLVNLYSAVYDYADKLKSDENKFKRLDLSGIKRRRDILMNLGSTSLFDKWFEEYSRSVASYGRDGKVLEEDLKVLFPELYKHIKSKHSKKAGYSLSDLISEYVIFVNNKSYARIFSSKPSNFGTFNVFSDSYGDAILEESVEELEEIIKPESFDKGIDASDVKSGVRDLLDEVVKIIKEYKPSRARYDKHLSAVLERLVKAGILKGFEFKEGSEVIVKDGVISVGKQSLRSAISLKILKIIYNSIYDEECFEIVNALFKNTSFHSEIRRFTESSGSLDASLYDPEFITVLKPLEERIYQNIKQTMLESEEENIRKHAKALTVSLLNTYMLYNDIRGYGIIEGIDEANKTFRGFMDSVFSIENLVVYNKIRIYRNRTLYGKLYRFISTIKDYIIAALGKLGGKKVYRVTNMADLINDILFKPLIVSVSSLSGLDKGNLLSLLISEDIRETSGRIDNTAIVKFYKLLMLTEAFIGRISHITLNDDAYLRSHGFGERSEVRAVRNKDTRQDTPFKRYMITGMKYSHIKYSGYMPSHEDTMPEHLRKSYNDRPSGIHPSTRSSTRALVPLHESDLYMNFIRGVRESYRSHVHFNLEEYNDKINEELKRIKKGKGKVSKDEIRKSLFVEAPFYSFNIPGIKDILYYASDGKGSYILKKTILADIPATIVREVMDAYHTIHSRYKSARVQTTPAYLFRKGAAIMLLKEWYNDVVLKSDTLTNKEKAHIKDNLLRVMYSTDLYLRYSTFEHLVNAVNDSIKSGAEGVKSITEYYYDRLMSLYKANLSSDPSVTEISLMLYRDLAVRGLTQELILAVAGIADDGIGSAINVDLYNETYNILSQFAFYDEYSKKSHYDVFLKLVGAVLEHQKSADDKSEQYVFYTLYGALSKIFEMVSVTDKEFMFYLSRIRSFSSKVVSDNVDTILGLSEENKIIIDFMRERGWIQTESLETDSSFSAEEAEFNDFDETPEIVDEAILDKERNIGNRIPVHLYTLGSIVMSLVPSTAITSRSTSGSIAVSEEEEEEEEEATEGVEVEESETEEDTAAKEDGKDKDTERYNYKVFAGIRYTTTRRPMNISEFANMVFFFNSVLGLSIDEYYRFFDENYGFYEGSRKKIITPLSHIFKIEILDSLNRYLKKSEDEKGLSKNIDALLGEVRSFTELFSVRKPYLNIPLSFNAGNITVMNRTGDDRELGSIIFALEGDSSTSPVRKSALIESLIILHAYTEDAELRKDIVSFLSMITSPTIRNSKEILYTNPDVLYIIHQFLEHHRDLIKERYDGLLNIGKKGIKGTAFEKSVSGILTAFKDLTHEFYEGESDIFMYDDRLDKYVKITPKTLLPYFVALTTSVIQSGGLVGFRKEETIEEGKDGEKIKKIYYTVESRGESDFIKNASEHSLFYIFLLRSLSALHYIYSSSIITSQGLMMTTFKERSSLERIIERNGFNGTRKSLFSYILPQHKARLHLMSSILDNRNEGRQLNTIPEIVNHFMNAVGKVYYHTSSNVKNNVYAMVAYPKEAAGVFSGLTAPILGVNYERRYGLRYYGPHIGPSGIKIYGGASPHIHLYYAILDFAIKNKIADKVFAGKDEWMHTRVISSLGFLDALAETLLNIYNINKIKSKEKEEDLLTDQATYVNRNNPLRILSVFFSKANIDEKWFDDFIDLYFDKDSKEEITSDNVFDVLTNRVRKNIWDHIDKTYGVDTSKMSGNEKLMILSIYLSEHTGEKPDIDLEVSDYEVRYALSFRNIKDVRDLIYQYTIYVNFVNVSSVFQSVVRYDQFKEIMVDETLRNNYVSGIAESVIADTYDVYVERMMKAVAPIVSRAQYSGSAEVIFNSIFGLNRDIFLSEVKSHIGIYASAIFETVKDEKVKQRLLSLFKASGIYRDGWVTDVKIRNGVTYNTDILRSILYLNNLREVYERLKAGVLDEKDIENVIIINKTRVFFNIKDAKNIQDGVYYIDDVVEKLKKAGIIGIEAGGGKDRVFYMRSAALIPLYMLMSMPEDTLSDLASSLPEDKVYLSYSGDDVADFKAILSKTWFTESEFSFYKASSMTEVLMATGWVGRFSYMAATMDNMLMVSSSTTITHNKSDTASDIPKRLNSFTSPGDTIFDTSYFGQRIEEITRSKGYSSKKSKYKNILKTMKKNRYRSVDFDDTELVFREDGKDREELVRNIAMSTGVPVSVVENFISDNKIEELTNSAGYVNIYHALSVMFIRNNGSIPEPLNELLNILIDYDNAEQFVDIENPDIDKKSRRELIDKRKQEIIEKFRQWKLKYCIGGNANILPILKMQYAGIVDSVVYEQAEADGEKSKSRIKERIRNLNLIHKYSLLPIHPLLYEDIRDRDYRRFLNSIWGVMQTKGLTTVTFNSASKRNRTIRLEGGKVKRYYIAEPVILEKTYKDSKGKVSKKKTLGFRFNKHEDIHVYDGDIDFWKINTYSPSERKNEVQIPVKMYIFSDLLNLEYYSYNSVSNLLKGYGLRISQEDYNELVKRIRTIQKKYRNSIKEFIRHIIESNNSLIRSAIRGTAIRETLMSVSDENNIMNVMKLEGFRDVIPLFDILDRIRINTYNNHVARGSMLPTTPFISGTLFSGKGVMVQKSEKKGITVRPSPSVFTITGSMFAVLFESYTYKDEDGSVKTGIVGTVENFNRLMVEDKDFRSKIRKKYPVFDARIPFQTSISINYNYPYQLVAGVEMFAKNPFNSVFKGEDNDYDKSNVFMLNYVVSFIVKDEKGVDKHIILRTSSDKDLSEIRSFLASGRIKDIVPDSVVVEIDTKDHFTNLFYRYSILFSSPIHILSRVIPVTKSAVYNHLIKEFRKSTFPVPVNLQIKHNSSVIKLVKLVGVTVYWQSVVSSRRNIIRLLSRSYGNAVFMASNIDNPFTLYSYADHIKDPKSPVPFTYGVDEIYKSRNNLYNIVLSLYLSDFVNGTVDAQTEAWLSAMDPYYRDNPNSISFYYDLLSSFTNRFIFSLSAKIYVSLKELGFEMPKGTDKNVDALGRFVSSLGEKERNKLIGKLSGNEKKMKDTYRILVDVISGDLSMPNVNMFTALIFEKFNQTLLNEHKNMVIRYNFVPGSGSNKLRVYHGFHVSSLIKTLTKKLETVGNDEWLRSELEDLEKNMEAYKKEKLVLVSKIVAILLRFNYLYAKRNNVDIREYPEFSLTDYKDPLLELKEELNKAFRIIYEDEDYGKTYSDRLFIELLEEIHGYRNNIIALLNDYKKRKTNSVVGLYLNALRSSSILNSNLDIVKDDGFIFTLASSVIIAEVAFGGETPGISINSLSKIRSLKNRIIENMGIDSTLRALEHRKEMIRIIENTSLDEKLKMIDILRRFGYIVQHFLENNTFVYTKHRFVKAYLKQVRYISRRGDLSNHILAEAVFYLHRAFANDIKYMSEEEVKMFIATEGSLKELTLYGRPIVSVDYNEYLVSRFENIVKEGKTGFQDSDLLLVNAVIHRSLTYKQNIFYELLNIYSTPQASLRNVYRVQNIGVISKYVFRENYDEYYIKSIVRNIKRGYSNQLLITYAMFMESVLKSDGSLAGDITDRINNILSDKQIEVSKVIAGGIYISNYSGQEIMKASEGMFSVSRDDNGDIYFAFRDIDVESYNERPELYDMAYAIYLVKILYTSLKASLNSETLDFLSERHKTDKEPLTDSELADLVSGIISNLMRASIVLGYSGFIMDYQRNRNNDNANALAILRGTSYVYDAFKRITEVGSSKKERPLNFVDILHDILYDILTDFTGSDNERISDILKKVIERRDAELKLTENISKTLATEIYNVYRNVIDNISKGFNIRGFRNAMSLEKFADRFKGSDSSFADIHEILEVAGDDETSETEALRQEEKEKEDEGLKDRREGSEDENTDGTDEVKLC